MQMLKLLRNKIQSLTKIQRNILTMILVLIDLGVIIFWISFWVSLPKITLPEEKTVEEEMFNLLAIVLSTNPENNFLIVNPVKTTTFPPSFGGPVEEREVKIIIDKNTALIKLESSETPPEEKEKKEMIMVEEGKEPTVVETEEPSLVQKRLKISDIKEGDKIYIKTSEDVTGKSEIDKINFIHIISE